MTRKEAAARWEALTPLDARFRAWQRFRRATHRAESRQLAARAKAMARFQREAAALALLGDEDDR